MKRLKICLFLAAAVLLCALFAACTKNGDDPADTKNTTEPQTTVTTEAPTTEEQPTGETPTGEVETDPDGGLWSPVMK